MRIPGLRHSAEQVGGIVFFGRMLDKIRLHAQGKLPPDYKRGTGTDGRVCRFLHVEYPAIVERLLAGATDDEILKWCLCRDGGRVRRRFSSSTRFCRSAAGRDSQTGELEQMKRERGFADMADIQTFFDFHKADEQSD